MAAIKRVKRKEGENLTPTNIERVIGLLEAEKPITKKEACEILSISYNTTRLSKIIEEYKADKEMDEKRRAANRGKPASPFEIQTCIEGYLRGDSLKEISDNLYRPVSFVKSVVESIGVPEKVVGGTYWNPGMLPEKCQTERFKIGQIVWAARYNAMAIVLDRYPGQDYDCYSVYVIETIDEPSPYFPHITEYGGKMSTQPVFELGSLEHLKEFGVDVYKPYRNAFSKWLSGDFSGLRGTKKWEEFKAAHPEEIYASC